MAVVMADGFYSVCIYIKKYTAYIYIYKYMPDIYKINPRDGCGGQKNFCCITVFHVEQKLHKALVKTVKRKKKKE